MDMAKAGSKLGFNISAMSKVKSRHGKELSERVLLRTILIVMHGR